MVGGSYFASSSEFWSIHSLYKKAVFLLSIVRSDFLILYIIFLHNWLEISIKDSFVRFKIFSTTHEVWPENLMDQISFVVSVVCMDLFDVVCMDLFDVHNIFFAANVSGLLAAFGQHILSHATKALF